MVKEIRIYVEGGGDRSDTKAAIREGFQKFLQPLHQLARDREIRWTIVPCGSRKIVFDNFKKARQSHPESFLVLLVDSEAPVTAEPWEHLRANDNWDSEDFPKEHCHLMVQTVEAWLIADPDALAGYYGQGFRRNALPRRQDVEAVPKQDLAQRLNRATQRTQKGRYHKIRHCSDLLGRLNQERVRARARHCDLLFTTLENRIKGGRG